MKLGVKIKKLPSYVLEGARPISRSGPSGFKGEVSQECVNEYLGVRRLNEMCLEVFSGGRTIKSAYSSAIGVMFLVGILSDLAVFSMISGPYELEIVFAIIITPIVFSAIGGLMYLITRGSQGSHVRISRKTGKIYYVIPGELRLVTLDWQEIQPMAASFFIAGGPAGHTVLNPLFLVGVDWTKSPPQEASISCGNIGWRDNGKSACELFSYIQHFMDYGPQGLPMPGPLPPKMSRKDTFLHGYRQWAKKFRDDLSTPKGKRWAVLWAPAKVLWLIAMVFPDSIGAYLDYTVPEVRFPEEIDLLCGFESDNGDLPNC